MTIISFEMFYFTIQLRFTKLSPYFWWYHCAICTRFYLLSYFAVICWDIFEVDIEVLFFSIKHSHLRKWRCLHWRNIFFFAKAILLIVLTWIWLGFASTLFWEMSHLFTGVAYYTYPWTGSARVWFTSTPGAHVVAFNGSTIFHLVFERCFWSWTQLLLSQ